MKRNFEIKEIQEIFDKASLKATAQRIAIYKYVVKEPKHITVDKIKKWTDKNFPKLSLATIYNTVNSFVEHGLIRAIKIPDQDKVIYDTNISKHFHFFDKNKEELKDIDIEISSIKEQLKEKYDISEIDIIVYGTEKK